MTAPVITISRYQILAVVVTVINVTFLAMLIFILVKQSRDADQSRRADAEQLARMTAIADCGEQREAVWDRREQLGDLVEWINPKQYAADKAAIRRDNPLPSCR